MIGKLIASLVLLSSAALHAYPLYDEDIVFYNSFDRGEAPDIAAGSDKVIARFGKVAFADGVRGKALTAGQDGAKLRYQRKDNIDFSRPGTLLFFYKPLEWEKSVPSPRLFFWGVEASDGFFGLQLANDPKNICACRRPIHVMMLYSKTMPNRVMAGDVPGDSGCSGWHMLALSWAGDQLFVQYDKQPAKQFKLAKSLEEADFPANHFSVGSDMHWRYLIDEFTVYNRRLSEAELNAVYDAVNAGGAK